MRRTITTGTLIVALLATGQGQAAGAKQEPKEAFVIKYPNIQWFDPVYVADEKGWFAEEGLKIEWWARYFCAARASGRLAQHRFRQPPYAAVLTARAGGAKIKIVAAVPRPRRASAHEVPGQSGKPIKTVKDLKARRSASTASALARNTCSRNTCAAMDWTRTSTSSSFPMPTRSNRSNRG